MADTVQTLSLIVLAQNYRNEIVKQANRIAVGLRLLPWKMGDTGKNLAWVASNTGMIAENYSEGADASNFGSDSQTGATLNWGMYRANFHVSGFAVAAARNSLSPTGVQDLVAENLVNACAGLASKVNEELYDGAGTGTLLCGLDEAIGSTSNTYAGIDRSQGANSYWRPTVSDPGALTAPTFAQIRSDMQSIYVSSGHTPDLAIVHPNVFAKIGSLFDSNRHYIQDISTARGPIRLDAGLGALEVDGMFFVKDKDADDNCIYYVNTNFTEVQYLPPADPAVFQAVRALEMQTNDGFGLTPLGCICDVLAKAGDSTKFQCRTYVQLVVRRPNTCGKRLNVATS